MHAITGNGNDANLLNSVLEKFVKAHQVNLFLAGFSHLKPLCGSGGGPAGDSGGLGGQQISMPTKLTQLRYSGYSAEFLDRVEPNGNIPGKNGTAGIAGMY